MARPDGMILTRITFGSAATIITGTPLAMRVTFAPTTDVVWAATGDVFVAFDETIPAASSGRGQVWLPNPDQNGFVDGAGNTIRNFAYKVTAVFTLGGAVVTRNTKYVTWTASDLGPIDLDLLIPVNTSPAVTVYIPDSWSAQVTAAQTAAQSAAASLAAILAGGAVSVTGNSDGTATVNEAVATNVLTPRTTAATVTTSGALTAGTHTPVDASSGNLTQTLPSTATVGAYLSVEKTDPSGNTVTISGSIRGAVTTLALTSQYESLTLIWSGATWRPTEGLRTITAINSAIDGKIAAQATTDAGVYETQTHAAATYSTPGSIAAAYVAQYATITALRAASSGAGPAHLLGYYSAGDGGGGVFRYDSTDTTSTDNGGTILTPTSALTGRWKRVYEGEINARWFGVNPSRTDNTAALQAAVTWAATDTTRQAGTASVPGGTVFIPFGYYKFTFTAGTSGLSTITIGCDNVLIRGEGRGTILTIRSPSAHVTNFFTITQSVRGQGGGVRDLHFEGNSQLEWCIYLNTWRNASFENVSARDVFSGILDGESANTVDLGENITVRHLDYISSSGTNSCFTQYGIRFRASSGGTMWTECSIRDCLFVGCWDTGVYLDGVARFTVSQIAAACDSTSTNTIDGTSRTGLLHAVTITNSIVGTWTADTGNHVVDGIYMESHAGGETTTANNAVWIDSPAGQTGLNRFNRISDVAVSTTTGPGILRITNTAASAGRTSFNTFIGNRRAINTNQIQIGASVQDTYLYLTPNSGQLSKVLDGGIRTYVNGIGAFNWGANYPSTVIGSSSVDVGMFSRDIATGRLVYMDKSNVPILVGPRPGLDVVSPYGSQRITTLATPAAPSITVSTTGTTTWTYYVAAVDKDGNRTPPSPAATVSNGPASLAGSSQNIITWSPVDGAVKYDLLRGSTTTSVATSLVSCYFADTGASTIAYSPASTGPVGTLAVDGGVTHGNGTTTLGGTFYSGTGVPSSTLGSNGDMYHRTDTPTTANQRLYTKSGGAWTGIL